MLAMVAVQNLDRLGNIERRRVRCYAIAPARCMSLNLAVRYADVINSVVLQASYQNLICFLWLNGKLSKSYLFFMVEWKELQCLSDCFCIRCHKRQSVCFKLTFISLYLCKVLMLRIGCKVLNVVNFTIEGFQFYLY